MSVFTGSGVAIVTPFNDDETINFPKLKELIEFQIENGTDAIIICGTTGEASTLTDEEQIECIKFTVDVVNKRVSVVAGAGSNHTEHAIKLAKNSEEVGADALLIVTPYYNKTTQKGLVAHYKAIADSVNIPIILYNVPGRTGMSIAPKTCLELSKIKNIVGIKEASGNFSNIAEIASICGPDFDIFSGNDDQTVPIMSLGGKGVISVLANIMPKEVHEMCDAYLKGDVVKAKDIQLKTLALSNSIFLDVNPIPIKEALNVMGFEVGPTKMPLCPMDEGHKEIMVKDMKDLGLVK